MLHVLRSVAQCSIRHFGWHFLNQGDDQNEHLVDLVAWFLFASPCDITPWRMRNSVHARVRA